MNKKIFALVLVIAGLVQTYFDSSYAATSYLGIRPGESTREEAEAVLGEPAKEINQTTFAYKPSQKNTEAVIVEYKPAGSKLVCDKIDVQFVTAISKGKFVTALSLPEEPRFERVADGGRLEEYYGSENSIILIYKGDSADSKITRLSYLSLDKFESLVKGLEGEQKPDSVSADGDEDEKDTGPQKTKMRDKPEEKETASVSIDAKQHLQQGMIYVSLAKANPKTKDENYNNALLEFSNAIKIYPKYAEAYSDRGVVYMQQKKYNKAEEDLKKAVELKPTDPIILYNLAALYSLEKKNDLALDYLDKSLEYGFNNFDALKPKGKNSDPDLANLRKDPEFKKVLEKHKVSTTK